MIHYYVLRTHKFAPEPSHKPDGMFIRADGCFTEHKQSAKVFTSTDEVTEYVEKWYGLHGPRLAEATPVPLYMVEVEAKVIMGSMIPQPPIMFFTKDDPPRRPSAMRDRR